MSALRPAGSTRAWRRLRRVVLSRDLFRCQLPGEQLAPAGSWAALHAGDDYARDPVLGRPLICGAFAEHVDHVTPRAAGGTDQLDQLRAACAQHNLARGARIESASLGPARRPTAGARRRWEW